MKLARVKGSVTATIKEAQLGNRKLLICDVVNGDDKVLREAIVAVDNLGAGRGDLVLLTTGSSARIPGDVAGAAIDTSVIAIVDEIDTVAPATRISKKGAVKKISRRRKANP